MSHQACMFIKSSICFLIHPESENALTVLNSIELISAI